MTPRIFQSALVTLLVVSLAATPVPNGEIPVTARKLLTKPRYSHVEVIRTDGRIEKGILLRVTNKFVALQPLPRTAACEDIPLSEVAAWRWLPLPGRKISDVAKKPLWMIAFAPGLIAEVVAEPFRKISPPLNPLRGEWEVVGGSRGGTKGSLNFRGATVKYRGSISTAGRWWNDEGKLHLAIGGTPERVTSFHFQCDNLVLDDTSEQLNAGNRASLGSSPILGDWGHGGMWLTLHGDGVLEEHQIIEREGSFQNTSTSVTIHWSDASGPGGGKWVANIRHGRIVVVIGGVETEFHYVPSPWIVM